MKTKTRILLLLISLVLLPRSVWAEAFPKAAPDENSDAIKYMKTPRRNFFSSETSQPTPKFPQYQNWMSPMVKEPEATAKNPAPKTLERRIASNDESQSYYQPRIRRRGSRKQEPDSELKVGLLGGMSSVTTADVTSQSARDAGGLGQSFCVGADADFRFHKYFGAELDAYYGLASLKQYGGIVNAKAQYPLTLGSWKWIPKIGVGYGLMALEHSDSASNLSLNGLVGVAGLDIEPSSFLTLSVDYSFSLGVSGSYSSPVASGDLTDAQFDRLRVGAYFKVYPGIRIGGQFTQRGMTSSQLNPSIYGSGNPGPTGNESQSQFLGKVMFEF